MSAEGDALDEVTPDLVRFVEDALAEHRTDEIRSLLKELSAVGQASVIEQVSDIPRTRSGKISEIAVRDVVNGRPVKNTEALANPQALAEYRHFNGLTLVPDPHGTRT